jgi:hypothetical protein
MFSKRQLTVSLAFLISRESASIFAGYLDKFADLPQAFQRND